MKWFKHYCGASRGDSLTDLRLKMGNEGYAFYFLFLELCAEKWDGEDEPQFTFNEVTIMRQLNCKRVKLELWLSCCSVSNLFQYTRTEDKLSFDLPNLKRLKQKDIKKKRDESDKEAAKSPLDKNNKNSERENNKNSEREEQKPQPEIPKPEKKSQTGNQIATHCTKIWEMLAEKFGVQIRFLDLSLDPDFRNATQTGITGGGNEKPISESDLAKAMYAFACETRDDPEKLTFKEPRHVFARKNLIALVGRFNGVYANFAKQPVERIDLAFVEAVRYEIFDAPPLKKVFGKWVEDPAIVEARKLDEAEARIRAKYAKEGI